MITMSSYEISKSSLLSLKAEILRKQEDLTRTKQENAEKIKTIKKKSLELKNKGVEGRQLNDLDDAEQDLLKLSKSKLEAKSKLYDKLSGNSEQSEELNRRYLVRFDKKSRVPEPSNKDNYEAPDDLPVDSEDEEKHNSDYYDEDINASDEWVEYTDCLGRTRTCLRKDLEYIKAKDVDLKVLTEKRQQKRPPTPEESCQETAISDESSEKVDGKNQAIPDENEMISGDMRREILRKQWEMEEEELRNKTDIHYQNVLFNEARQHGVGYYGFSKDDDERAKQQEALRKLRLETEQQQKKAQDLKALREKQMALRMKAARNRRRARLGLPPEEDEPTTESSKESKEDHEKKQEETEKLKEAEKMLDEARKRHVRPWDIGKEGVSEFYQMSQEEWNEKKRRERPTEFAPPVVYSKREFSSMKVLEADVDDSVKSLRFSTRRSEGTKSNKRKLRNINPYKNSKLYESSEDNRDSITLNNSRDEEQIDSSDRLMEDYMQSDTFSTCKNNSYEPTSDIEDDNLLSHYKISQSSVNKTEPTPIVNEVEETYFEDALLADYHQAVQNNSPEKADRLRRKETEIAPPPTFDYYGPRETKKVKSLTGQINIAQSIEAGLKYLRNQTERKKRRFDDKL